MSDQQIDQVKLQTIQRYSDLKKRKAAIEAQIGTWRKHFDRVVTILSHPAVTEREIQRQSVPNQLRTLVLGDDQAIIELPSGKEILDRLRELRQIVDDLEEAKKQIAGMGLDLS